MSDQRTCRYCGKPLWTTDTEIHTCEDCQTKYAIDPKATSSHESHSTSELPKDFSSFVKQTGEIPGAFADAVLEKVRLEATATPPPPLENDPLWSWQAGVLVWLASVAAIYFVGFIALIVGIFYLRSLGQPLTTEVMETSVPFAIIQILGTLPAHLLSLSIAWGVVTRLGKRPFLATMGWKWHPHFGPIHVVVSVVLMFAIGILIARFVPDHPTPFQHLMELITSNRMGRVALFAAVVISAPFEEEVIYRGVLYPALQNKFGMTWAIIIVSMIFGGVHIPQYWPSYQSITFIMTLSIGLTMVRAYTKSILPTFAIHLLFNLTEMLLSFKAGH
jgi:membrane protease YdiL (CAAX protease family)